VAADFITNYLPLALFPVLYAGAKFYYYKNGKGFALTPVEKLDFVTDIAEIEADTYVFHPELLHCCLTELLQLR